MATLQVSGGDALYRLARALRQAGETEIRNGMTSALRRSTKPLIEKNREAARQILPKKGGLNELIAAAPQKVQIRTGPRTAGVRIVAGGVKDQPGAAGAAGADKGMVRHPVYGNAKVWRVTKVKPGWFSDTMTKNAPDVLPLLVEEMEQVVEFIAKRGAR